MASRFKLTAMELAALSVLTLAVTAIAITLIIKGCNEDGSARTATVCDSITTAIEAKLAAPDSVTETVRPKRKKTKKAETTKPSRKTPKQRNHLDETVNE